MTKEQFEKDLTKLLRGKMVKEVRYLTEEECENMDWSNSALVIIFTDDSYIFPSMDPEGNGPGTLFTSFPGFETIGDW